MFDFLSNIETHVLFKGRLCGDEFTLQDIGDVNIGEMYRNRIVDPC